MATELPSNSLSEGSSGTPTDLSPGFSVLDYCNAPWESKSLDRAEMQQLLAEGEVEKRAERIRGRCNYWLFDNLKIRTERRYNTWKWSQLLADSQGFFREDYMKPNDDLHHPPEEYVYKSRAIL